ncbi:MAG: hypothetical protein J2P28_22950 [Actinobacteria bacterium]|nr:hypothetical protein [Actinomycetota bacterium]
MAEEVLTMADSQAAKMAVEAAAIREAAEREAAEMRQSAGREVAELRARLSSMSGELDQVAAYVTDSSPVAATSGFAPEFQDVRPAPRRARAALPAGSPARSDTRPGTRAAGPARQRTASASRQRTASGNRQRPASGRQQQARPRQKHAMRVFSYATATVLLFALLAGATEIAQHGLKFFIFRESGQGQTEDGGSALTDNQFLAKQAQHTAAPQGRHAKG